jgi:hypothetical protein
VVVDLDEVYQGLGIGCIAYLGWTVLLDFVELYVYSLFP